jgi:DNA-binding IclR family transcriptional regulator
VVIFRPGAPWRVVSVAAPVHGRGGIVAAVSVIVPESAALNPLYLTGAVRMASHGISRSWTPG